ncbi:MAG: glycosyltransferase, partial [Candidatus Zixiibacteriota bacterium]
VPGYHRNISVRRLLDHLVGGWRAARAFQHIPEAEQPDVIVVSLPTLELAAAAVRYGKTRGIPVMVDVRDLWPDYFLTPFPEVLHPVVKPLLGPYYAMARYACRNATALTGVAEPFVDWALQHAGRERSRLDRCHYFGYAMPSPDGSAADAAARFWDQLGVPAVHQTLRLLFLGSLAPSMDLETVIAAVRLANQRGIPAELIICGDGELRPRLEAFANHAPEIHFAGFVELPHLVEAMRRSDLAVAPYVPEQFQRMLSNKMVEYLAGGLPILTPMPQGVLVQLLQSNDCGLVYKDTEDLVRILDHLYSDRARLSTMSENARSVYESRFSWPVVMDDWEQHLHELSNLKQTSGSILFSGTDDDQ